MPPLTHLAMASAIVHPGVTSAIIGPRTMEQSSHPVETSARSTWPTGPRPSGARTSAAALVTSAAPPDGRVHPRVRRDPGRHRP
jgi:hypothetical protein